MFSSGARPGGKSIAAAVAAVALVGAGGSPAALAQGSGGDALEQVLLDQVQEILSRDGSFSRELLEPLADLSVLYRDSDDAIFALTTLERAVNIVRINDGLHSLNQLPFIRRMIRLEHAIGDHSAAWDREQGLLDLISRHPDDLRVVPALREIGDRQMALLSEVLAGETPPEVYLGCYLTQWPATDASCHAGSRSNVVQGVLADAQRSYATAIGVLLRHGLQASDEVRELELALLRGVDLMRVEYYGSPSKHPVPLVPAYVGTTNVEPWTSRLAPLLELREWEVLHSNEAEEGASRNRFVRHVLLMQPYSRGRQSLRRLYLYAAASEATSLQRVDAMVQLADWELLHSHNGQATDGYAEAYEILARVEMPSGSVEHFFSPVTPVVLPAFQPNPLEDDDPRSATGHIDVALEITRYGQGRAIEILQTENATADEQDDLILLLKRQRYRPRLTDGAFAAVTPVVFRYYLHD